MKKLFCLGVIAVAMVSFVACGTDSNDQTDKDNKPVVEENNDDKGNEEQVKPDKDKENVDADKPATDGTQTDGNKEPEIEEDKTERIFQIVTKDIDYNLVKGKEVKTIGRGVAENIKEILKVVSKEYFDGNGVDLTTIETVNKKKIAVVNLVGADYWSQAMQGSAGGQITEYTLIENVLQKEYKGYWVDGVRFTIDGKEVKDNGHIPNLSTTTYRK